MLLLPLLLEAILLRLATGSHHPFYNGFYYNHVMNDKGNGQEKDVYFNGARLVVETPKDPIYSSNGANVTLPCHYHYEPYQEAKRKIRIKWSKLRDDYTKEQDVLVAIGKTHMAFGDFQGRAHLHQASWREASLVISDVHLQDEGKYRCEVIDGLEDESDVVDLQLQGEVFYLDHPAGMTLEEAKQSCQDAGAEIARVGHLYSAWKFLGLDRCDAGWLADGSVRYPIAKPRPNCGPAEPGVRSFGFPSKGRFGVFCYKER